MKELLHRLTSFKIWSSHSQYVLLFDESAAASDIAFMLGGHWDGCNGVVVDKCDEVAVNTAASLVGASWCYEGVTLALLIRLTADELFRRYAAGERNFVNANLRCALLSKRLLSEVNLSYAKLRQANLSEANLTGADLTAADLSEADLSQASLSKTCLVRTNLTKANLSQADLRGANLSKACLSEANLSQADLTGANLSLANLRGAKLSGANLNGVAQR
jgi:uncharacterized protein YjbI with pentapeptide repeats